MTRGPTSLAVACLLLLALALRVAWIHADPPPGLSWSSGIYTDAAANTLLARFEAEGREGALRTGGAGAAYPLLNAAAWAAYRVLGIHRWSEGLLAALLGVASVGALAAALRRGPGHPAAVFALLLGATSAFLVPYSRILMAELVAAPLLALSCRQALERRTASLVVAGFLAVAAALFGKLNAVGFLPALLAFVWLRRGAAAGAGPVVLGGLLAAAAWGLLIFLPRREAWLGFMTGTSVAGAGLLPASLGDALLGPFETFREAWMFHEIPVVGAAGGAFALWTLSGREVLRRRVEDGSALFAFWCLSVFAYHSALGYVAPRYFVLLALPLTACAACLAAEWWQGRGGWTDARRPGEWIVLAVLSAFLGFGLVNLVFHADLQMRLQFGWREAELHRAVEGPVLATLVTLEGNTRWGLIAGAVLLPVLLLGARLEHRAPVSLRRVALVTLCLAVALDLIQWTWWATHRRYTIQRTTEAVGALLSPGAVLLGAFAPLVTEGTAIVPFPTFGAARDAEAWKSVTHVLATDPGEDPAELFPELHDPLVLVQVWAFAFGSTRHLELYRLPESALSGRYVPSDLELGIADAREGRFDDALQHVAAHRRAGRPETSDLLVLEATCLAARSDLEGAERELRAAVMKNPEDVTALRNLGYLVMRSGDREGALRLWWRAIRLEPGDATLRDLILRASGESSEP